MKIKIILLAAVAVFFGFNVSYGQTVISPEEFQKAVNYLNCRTVELSLKKSDIKGTLGTFQTNTKNCTNIPNSDAIKNAIDAREANSIALADEMVQIKDHRIDPMTRESVIEYLTGSVFNDEEKNPKLAQFTKDNTDSVMNLKEQLKQDFFTKILVQQPTSGNSNNNKNTNSLRITITPTQAPTQTHTPITPPVDNETNWFYWLFSWFVTLLPIALPIVLFLLFIKPKHEVLDNEILILKQRLSNIGSKANTVPQKTMAQSSSNSNLNFNETEEKLRATISALENRIKLLEERPVVQAPERTQQITMSRIPDSHSERETKNEIFYFPTPNEGGTFNASSAQVVYKEGASIYKFTKTSQSHAEFQIDERDSSIQQAMRYPETNIEPVCEAENSRTDSEKRIVTTHAGKAILNGEKWIVTQKAKIRYEH